MTTHELQMMMLDIDGVLTRHHADTTDVLAAAQALATSAIGDLANKGNQPDTLHRAAHPSRTGGSKTFFNYL